MGGLCIRSRPVVLQLGCVLEFIKGVLRITDAWPHSQRCQSSLGGTLALMIFKCSLVILLQPGWEPVVCHIPLWSSLPCLIPKQGEEKVFIYYLSDVRGFWVVSFTFCGWATCVLFLLILYSLALWVLSMIYTHDCSFALTFTYWPALMQKC